MTEGEKQKEYATTLSGSLTDSCIISIDAMGGDFGPEAVISGLSLVLEEDQSEKLFFIVHGEQKILSPLVNSHPILAERVELRHSSRSVTMDDKPSQVMRHGKDTSMWSAISSVKNGEANAVVSSGNTGALMAISMVVLRRLSGLDRPAIACLWPNRSTTDRFNVMLDVGAEVEADADDLLRFATMGAVYAKEGLGRISPRIGLLNVGTEKHKGRPVLQEAYEKISAFAKERKYNFVGFVEGSDIASENVDVIVTDGFSGNIALKTGEGTAQLIVYLLKETLKSSLLAKMGSFLALRALNNMQQRVDPRYTNGGVFLGLSGTVIKSHGASDATGFASAVKLAIKLARSGFINRLSEQLTGVAPPKSTPLSNKTQKTTKVKKTSPSKAASKM